jgi:hypothetical protein
MATIWDGGRSVEYHFERLPPKDYQMKLAQFCIVLFKQIFSETTGIFLTKPSHHHL